MQKFFIRSSLANNLGLLFILEEEEWNETNNCTLISPYHKIKHWWGPVQVRKKIRGIFTTQKHDI